MWEEYCSPSSVKEALKILYKYDGQARVIAGGTDLVLELKKKTRDIKCLVDITDIEELKKIQREVNTIKIGAGVTHSEVASSKLIIQYAMVLAEAASAVGSPLIRNLGTIVGNVLNAQPAADTAVALFALEAKAEISTQKGNKLVPIEKLYKGIGISEVDSTIEIVTAIQFKKPVNNTGSAFTRLSQRKALALPVLNVAALVTIKDTRYDDARIVIAPVANMPFRSGKAELLLKGAPINLESIKKAAEIAAYEAQPRDSALRGSAKYRQEMVKVLVKRALEQATLRARER